jgi:hypothetical protein
MLDVPSRAAWKRDGAAITRSLPVLVDEIATWAAGQSSPRPIVTCYTGPHEATSTRAARHA